MKKGRIISYLFILWFIMQTHSLIAQQVISATFPEIRNTESNYSISKKGIQLNLSETRSSGRILLIPVVFDHDGDISKESGSINLPNGRCTVSGEIGIQNVANEIVHVSIYNPTSQAEDAPGILFDLDLDQHQPVAYFSFGLDERPESLMLRIEYQGEAMDNNEDLVLLLENIRLQIEPSQKALPIKIYPNPASQKLTIEFQPFENSREIALFNMLGNCVKLSVLHSPESLLQINISDLPEGYYIVVVKADKQQIFSDRIIIERN